LNEKELIQQIEQNQHAQKEAGHHGVPGLVYEGQYYFGQDKFDEFKQALINDNLLKA
jgi:2-hydroxychromene-2-carboxylate isomerase